ncbi:MAG: hypothetical protein J0H17_10390, partial [Rhizobiales bacterium]|nr:hypothetical protein [Hyphomicrobiales bacterium]
HGGMEIKLSDEPLDAVKQIIRACDGRFSEVGGIYKVYVGAPGLPVASIVDGHLRADEGDSFKPVLPLMQRVNYVTATYMEPGDSWNPKVAPPRGNDEYEAIDGRRLEADLDLQLVQSAAHIQRLQLQMLKRSRRERRHTIPLGPEFFGIEPGDIIEWNSDRNGYVDKLFEVDSVELFDNLNSSVSVIEVDPDDYDWNGETDFVEQPATSLVVDRPSPKIIEGFNVASFIYSGDTGTQYPAIGITWTLPEDGDVSGVRWQMRPTARPDDVATGNTDDVAAEAVVILGGLQPLTGYDARARFESFNGYASDWSLWQSVTTPNVSILASQLEDQIKKTLAQVEPNVAAVSLQTKAVIDKWVTAKQKADDLLGQVKRVQASSDAAHAAIVQNQTVQESQNEAFVALFTAMAAQVAANSAGIVSEASVRAERDGAITSLLTALTSATNGNSAAIVSEASTRSSADSAMASDITGLTTTVGGHTASIGTLTSTVNGVKVQFGVTGTINGVTGGFVFTGIAKLDGSVSYTVEINGDLVVDGTITGGKLAATDIITLSAQIQAAIIKTAHIDNLQVTRLKIGDDEVNIDKLEQGAAAATAYQDHAAIRTLASPWTSGLPGDFRDVVSLSITTIGDGVEMFYYVRYLAFYRNTGISSGSRAPVQFRFVVDGTPEDTFDFVATEKAGTVFYIDEPIVLASFKATLSAGAHTIKIQANRGAGNYTGGDTADNEIGPGRLKVIELRKAA